MAQIGLLVTELKRYLKAQGITYAALAKQLNLSESSVKRQFARQSFSLARLEQILNLVGLEIADLIVPGLVGRITGKGKGWRGGARWFGATVRVAVRRGCRPARGRVGVAHRVGAAMDP